MTNQELSNRMTHLEQSVKALDNRLSILAEQMALYATQGQLKTSESNTKNIINSNSQAINVIEEKLLTIALPNDTKYYLKVNEITDFRSN